MREIDFRGRKRRSAKVCTKRCLSVQLVRLKAHTAQNISRRDPRQREKKRERAPEHHLATRAESYDVTPRG
eukprot:31303-Pelagococcus_subviridis.AAC.11